MKKLYIFLFLTFVFASIICGQQTNRTLTWDSVTREYIEDLPDSYNGSNPVPVVFCLHGLGDNMTNFLSINFDAIAENWIVITPQALLASDPVLGELGTAWNSGFGFDDFPFLGDVIFNENVDDAGFLIAILDSLENHYNINSDSIFFMGFSVGGYMANRMAAEYSERITAIASVSGTIGRFFTPEPTENVNTLHIHGTTDEVIFYETGMMNTSSGLYSVGMGAEECVDFWRNYNNCEVIPIIDTFPDIAEDGKTFEQYLYFNGDNNSYSSLIKVIGGEHEWYYTPQNDISYCNEIYKFFIRAYNYVLPVSYNISASANNYCAGESGVEILLDGSQSGVTYELYESGEGTGITLNGNGSELIFQNITEGSYSIIATDEATSIQSTMSGNVVIEESQLPTIFNLSASSISYCSGNEGVNILLDGSELDVIYEILESGNSTGITLAGTGTELSFTGITAGNYTILASGYNSGCTEIMTGSQEITESDPYQFITTESICDGEQFVWRGSIYTTENTYNEFYSTVGSGCDSIYTLILTVNPLPEQITVIADPSDGILEAASTGSISLSTSYTATDYWVSMGGAIFTENILGTGTSLILGTNYTEGTFDIWSLNEFGCQLLQGSASFVENNGNNKLAVSISYGTTATNFPAGEAIVSLYKLTTDIDMSEVILLDQQQTLGENGLVIFENIEPGDYYLGSALVNPSNYDLASHVYYQAALTHEDAVAIPMTESTIYFANINHSQLNPNEGSNYGGGTVLEGGSKSELTPLANMVVILYNSNLEEIIDVCITNESGEYVLPSIPDNTNIKLYVSSFEHPLWTPYNLLTTTEQHYSINFVVDGVHVYPLENAGNNIKSETNICIYPNPTSGIINIKADYIKNIKITNLEGQIILAESINSDYAEIDLSSCSIGIYLIKVETNEGVKVEKVIVE